VVGSNSQRSYSSAPSAGCVEWFDFMVYLSLPPILATVIFCLIATAVIMLVMLPRTLDHGAHLHDHLRSASRVTLSDR
jgi:hypothetical protein